MYNWMYNQPAVQDNFIISAPNMDYVNNYPLVPGSSVLFKLENEPVIVEKTRGYSQMDAPVVSVYRLEKETPKEETIYVTKKDFDELKKYVDVIAKEVVPHDE